jgi:hypothetical protein
MKEVLIEKYLTNLAHLGVESRSLAKAGLATQRFLRNPPQELTESPEDYFARAVRDCEAGVDNFIETMTKA